jgi:hypothetical protein
MLRVAAMSYSSGPTVSNRTGRAVVTGRHLQAVDMSLDSSDVLVSVLSVGHFVAFLLARFNDATVNFVNDCCYIVGRLQRNSFTS